MRFSRKGVSVLPVLDRRRMKVSGLYPVKIEVTFRRRQKYFTTGVDLSEDQWRTVSSSGRKRCRIEDIEECFNRVRNEVADMLDKNIFTFSLLEIRLGRSSCYNVNSSLRAMMEKCREEGRINSFYRYRSALRGIEKFSGPDVAFSCVTAEWLVRCERFWKKEGKSNTTVEIYMKTLKSVLNEARKEGYIKDTPFGRECGYLIPRGNSRKLALSKSQIRKVIDFRGDESLEKFRDMWLFSYLCNGINFKDMLFLRYGNVVDGEIRFVRSKTEHSNAGRKVICATLRPEMQAIISRWGNPYDGSPDTLIFRFAEGSEDEFRAAMLVRRVVCQCNTALKIIAEELGIPAFTTYSARHSFATVMQQSGAGIPFISDCLGHSSISVTKTYLAGFTPEERLRHSAMLIELD